jgi:outer membrane lipoprotein carrier protein
VPDVVSTVRPRLQPAPAARVRHRASSLVLLLAIALQPLAAHASDAVARVEAYLSKLQTLSADFVQIVQDRRGQVTDRATGTLSLQRPDRFRWDYREPHEQVIVADGRQVWLYDPDLEQVTVRTLEQGLGSTPAMLLSGTGKVGDAFTAGPVERSRDWTWCRLVPKQHGSDFERVSLAFDAKNELAAMELVDKLGQTTLIEFRQLRRGARLDEGLFRFVPPPGADVIGTAAQP